ncbi:MAG: response regulator [Roseburia sp.]
MKTVLIVEDEKLIRQGIKTMIQRSGVPVDVIMECSNGETALEVIREEKIDVMFTDIRMPKMDGIELVRRMQECEHVPLTVAISGYDDFSYAVEMLRNGVREYILKPIEREKITEILKKLNAEIESNQEKNRTIRKLGYQQMKHLMLSSNTTDDEMRMLETQYEKEFYEECYVVCCQNVKERSETANKNYIYLKEMDGNDVFVVREAALDLLLKNELKNGYVGISGSHQGLRELRQAYLEALAMRKKAFCRNMEAAEWQEEEHIPEKLVQEAEKLISSAAKLQRVQLLGTDRTEEVERVWQQFFYEVKNGRIKPEQYEDCMEDFFREAGKTYRNVIKEDVTKSKVYLNFFEENCINDQEKVLMKWALELHENINNQLDVNRNRQKIKQAVEYIEANYAKDLNMAVVSNYISMNYSLFSYSFKQYTGSNFVNYLKDIRMREAKKLLAETDMRIIEISQEVGYDNEKHFMKIFKASCGVSPSEYRKNMQQD